MFISKPQTRSACLTAISLVLALALPEAWALPSVNLTNETFNNVSSQSTGDIVNTMGKVTFARDATQPAGTGVFNPFLRLDVKGNLSNEQGYNTSAKITEGPTNNQTTRKILDNMSPENWTHDVLFSDLQLNAAGTHYEFKLDINEPGNGMSLLSLDGLKLYSTGTPSQSGELLNNTNFDIVDGDPSGPGSGIVGNKLWDMDAGGDSSVLLDARVAGGPGSGVADMIMLVEKSIFDKRNTGENYLILWSRFGLTQGANTGATTADAGFEEWSYSSKTGGGGGGCTTNCNQAPTPGTASLALLALGILGFRHLSRKTPVVAV